MSIGDAEIKTQERVIRFFKDPEILGYQYIGNLSDYQNKNIKEDRLRQYLRLKGYADKLIDPRGAISKEDGSFPLINTDECIGCGACQNACPVKAITVMPIEQQKIL